MRRLILLRHAKSDWSEGLPDVDRPLAPRGREAAPRVGRYLAREGLAVDHVLVSPARRTQETWELVSAELSPPPAASTEPRIYEASTARLLEIVQEQPDTCHVLMMVGHNPGFETLADLLVQSGSQIARSAMDEKFPTGAVAVIDLPVDHWSEVAPRSGRLDRFVAPRTLADDS
ncbi:MAG: phosphoglycerate mutase [Xanthobacter sp. 17-67-6]|nr:MAG: phosphoglycerate mutase [Rhizobiales bacterium 12-68-15]OYX87295.1 MAG: phosphoglycerate mutase [Azorhizobium sp. 32-67-21]OYZ93901.1 MAG: phosphoglycerate mutase [Xanthobacter sp. 17-67-6]